MARRSNLPQPALSATTSGRSGRRVRDPLTRLLFFCQLMALGLVAASAYLTFPNDLNRPGGPVVTLDRFPTLLEKCAIVATHTRTPWIVLAVIGLLTALIAQLTRRRPKRSRWVAYAPVALFLVVAVHAAAQGWLQSRGPLHLEFRGPAPARMENPDSLPLTLPGTTAPAPLNFRVGTITATAAITRLMIPEGTAAQWKLLFGGDLLFAVPLLFAWVLSFAQAVVAGGKKMKIM